MPQPFAEQAKPIKIMQIAEPASALLLRASALLLRASALLLAASALLFTAPAHALTNEEIAHLKGPERAAILEKGARAEGALTVYSSLIVDQVLRPLVDAFSKTHAYLKIDYWRGEARPIIQKVLAEL